MAQICFKTKNTSKPADKKPRVYFTCHPDDFSLLKRITNDLFATHDCTVYYAEGQRDVTDEADLEATLGRCNLFVVPVTKKLLTEKCPATETDLPFALAAHIPVLPIMMEKGLDALYAAAEIFGELQYLQSHSEDATEIAYEDKLKKYLDAVLVNDETADRIRAAFDAYIFLSYRKKDRKYANELMRFIHKNPCCRDIAVWFDEFLTPGESFKENIRKVLQDSRLFALLVTPNLLEEPDGIPNYVMGVEYPAACEAGISVLPAEMVETDKTALADKFQNLPLCVNAYDDAAFQERLLETVSRLAIRSNDTPEHNYFIGLAYLEGIDVEVDHRRALSLIASSAEAGLPLAMDQLFGMYLSGRGVARSYEKAVYWGEKLYAHYKETQGENHPDTVISLNNLAMANSYLGEHQKAMEMMRTAYARLRNIYGQTHDLTMSALGDLATTYDCLKDYPKLLEVYLENYALRCRMFGEESVELEEPLWDLRYAYEKLGNLQKVAQVREKLYTLQRQYKSEESFAMRRDLQNLAEAFRQAKDFKKALQLYEKLLILNRKIDGEEDLSVLSAKEGIARTFSDMGEHQKALPLYEEAYAKRNEAFDGEFSFVFDALFALGFCHLSLGHAQSALSLFLLLQKRSEETGFGAEEKLEQVASAVVMLQSALSQ